MHDPNNKECPRNTHVCAVYHYDGKCSRDHFPCTCTKEPQQTPHSPVCRVCNGECWKEPQAGEGWRERFDVAFLNFIKSVHPSITDKIKAFIESEIAQARAKDHEVLRERVEELPNVPNNFVHSVSRGAVVSLLDAHYNQHGK